MTQKRKALLMFAIYLVVPLVVALLAVAILGCL